MMHAPLPFSQLSLNQALLTNLASLDYEQMTPIQAQTLPLILNGSDVIAKANTGSGKTAAFGLSLLNTINPKQFAVQGLVICPTRELAEQIRMAIAQLARLMPNIKIINLSGGIPMRPQLDSLKHGAHIIVGTPGRIQKHLDKATLKLDSLQTLVLDEADRMLDMGFLDSIRHVIKSCPRNRQTLLFSATYPVEIKRIAFEFMKNPIEIITEDAHIQDDIEQICYEVKEDNKFSVLTALLTQQQASSTLIFCNTKQQTNDLTRELKQLGFSAIALNGDLEQLDRDLAIIQFTNLSCAILVATDVAARGLDIKELPLVINYELAFESDTHTHRIGRTGRAGSKGLAINLVTPNESARLCAIEDQQKKPMIWGIISQLPPFKSTPPQPTMITIMLNAGKKDKLRPGDILGALTQDLGLTSQVIGKINILAIKSYVAIDKPYANQVLKYFQTGRLKGRRVQALMIRS